MISTIGGVLFFYVCIFCTARGGRLGINFLFEKKEGLSVWYTAEKFFRKPVDESTNVLK